MSTQLLVGGRVYSPAAPDATAMAVTDGQVVWLGADRPGRALHPDAEVVDLAGAFVTPGIVDTHVHTTAAGLALTGLDLSAARSRAHALALLREHAATTPGGVLWVGGWDDAAWDGAAPLTTADLDAAAPGRAVYAARVDAHSAAASTALRELAGASLPAAAGYHPQTALTADAHHLVRRAARSSLTAAQRGQARTALLDHAASKGVVCVHECGGPDIGGLEDFQELAAMDHGVQVRGYWGQAAATAEEALALLAGTGAHALGGDLFVDGALGSRTACLHQPYSDAPHTRGNAYLDPDTVAAHLRACTQARVQAGFHVIGDAAVTTAARALAQVAAELGGPAVAALGHRLEHVEMVTPDQAATLGRYGAVASVQPMFDALWGGPDGMYAARLGAARAAGLNPFATLAAAGATLAFGSDAPVTPIDPWPMLRAAVHHRTPGSGVSPRAAFAAATRGAWRAGGVRDGLAGTLVPGAPASYAVWEAGELVIAAPSSAVQRWSTDPRSRVAPLPDLDGPLPVCLRTVHRGRVLYERP